MGVTVDFLELSNRNQLFRVRCADFLRQLTNKLLGLFIIRLDLLLRVIIIIVEFPVLIVLLAQHAENRALELFLREGLAAAFFPETGEKISRRFGADSADGFAQVGLDFFEDKEESIVFFLGRFGGLC